jgi:AraC-like DNA-binding protein
VTFAADWNAIEIHRSWLDIKLGNTNRYVFGLFSDRAQALMRALQASTTLEGRLEAAILPKLHTGATTMAWAARALGLSRSALYRALRAEGLTFERLLDGLRRKMARHYLASRKLSVNETAYLVGFSDPAAFSRAYKRWTGASPSVHMGTIGGPGG